MDKITGTKKSEIMRDYGIEIDNDNTVDVRNTKPIANEMQNTALVPKLSEILNINNPIELRVGHLHFKPTRKYIIYKDMMTTCEPLIKSASKEFMEKYSGWNVEKFMSDFYLELGSLIEPILKQMNCIYEKYEEPDPDFIEAIFKNCLEFVEEDLGKIYGKVCEAYQATIDNEEEARLYREFRKATRTRVYGVGSSFKGMVEAAGNAAVYNAMSGIGHSIGNAIGNMASSMIAIHNRNKILRNKYLTECVQQCVNIFFGNSFTLTYGILAAEIESPIEKTDKLLNTINENDENYDEQLRDIMAMCPENSKCYCEYVRHYGDRDFSAEITAAIFGVEEDLRNRKKDFAKKECENLDLIHTELPNFQLENMIKECFCKNGVVGMEDVVINKYGMSYNQLWKKNRTIEGVVVESPEEFEKASEEIPQLQERFNSVDSGSIKSIRECKEWVRDFGVTSAKRHFISELNKMDIALRTVGDVVYDTFKEAEENRIRLKYKTEWEKSKTVMGVTIDSAEEIERAIEEIPLILNQLEMVDRSSTIEIQYCREWISANCTTSAQKCFQLLVDEMDLPYRVVDGRVYSSVTEAQDAQERRNRAQSDVQREFGNLEFSVSTYSNKLRIEGALEYLRGEFPQDAFGNYTNYTHTSKVGTVWNYVIQMETILIKYAEYEHICMSKGSGIFGSSQIKKEYERYLRS